jgi:hypothetical protein
LVVKHVGKRPLGRAKWRWENSKIDSKDGMRKLGLDSSGSR